jgi:DNA-binding MarR family transcriptional regulator
MPSIQPIADLEQAWVSIVRRAELPAVQERLQRASGIDLGRGPCVVLSRLNDLGPQQVSELAYASGLDVSTMSRMLKQLVQDGLVERGTGDDRRCSVVNLSDAGRDVVLRFRETGQDFLAQVLADWSTEDVVELSRLMARLAYDFAAYVDAPTAPRAVDRRASS